MCWNPFNPDDYKEKDDVKEDAEHFEHCYEQSIKFIKKQYLDRNSYQAVYVHTGSISDTNSVAKVIGSIETIVIRSSLRRGGLLIQ